MTRDEKDWISEYTRRCALWMHDGNPKRPHAVLRSGLHSNGFFNSREVILMPGEQDDDKSMLMREVAEDLLEMWGPIRRLKAEVTGFVGPQTGATRMAEFLRDQASELTDDRIRFYASPAKEEKDGAPIMVFKNENEIKDLPSQKILLCEDVITTGGSIERTAVATIAGGATVLPFVLCLVNRSGMKEIGGRKIISLISRDLPQWTAEECPLCAQGSKALTNVKEPDNWAALNAKY